MEFHILKKRGYESEFATEYLTADNAQSGDAPKCKTCGKYTGMRIWLAPFDVEIELTGKCFGDIAFGPGYEILISEKFKNSLNNFKFSGFGAFNKVNIVKVKPKRMTDKVPAYYATHPQYGSALVDYKKSGIVTEGNDRCQDCNLCGIIKRAERIILIQDTWKGEDIFYSKGLPGIIVVSNKFVQFCNEFNITNAIFVPIEDYSFDFYPWEK